MSKIIPLKELNERIDTMISDAKYDLNRARSPKSKRNKESFLYFFKSIKHYIKEENK
ncbi:hypothetical protein OAC88_02875 [Flavobacteriaceae bacterium]|nr:hypothetical protein [Flavobacteriaceae bacterium]